METRTKRRKGSVGGYTNNKKGINRRKAKEHKHRETNPKAFCSLLSIDTSILKPFTFVDKVEQFQSYYSNIIKEKEDAIELIKQLDSILSPYYNVWGKPLYDDNATVGDVLKDLTERYLAVKKADIVSVDRENDMQIVEIQEVPFAYQIFFIETKIFLDLKKNSIEEKLFYMLYSRLYNFMCIDHYALDSNIEMIEDDLDHVTDKEEIDSYKATLKEYGKKSEWAKITKRIESTTFTIEAYQKLLNKLDEENVHYSILKGFLDVFMISPQMFDVQTLEDYDESNASFTILYQMIHKYGDDISQRVEFDMEQYAQNGITEPKDFRLADKETIMEEMETDFSLQELETYLEKLINHCDEWKN